MTQYGRHSVDLTAACFPLASGALAALTVWSMQSYHELPAVHSPHFLTAGSPDSLGDHFLT